ncbi:MAG: hypothetical protein E5W55_02040 [Mesorhizobium sp.]|nr:MAG: hypothetical protein E5W55_02040 [Mesorhizobium sp.]
MDGFLHFDGTSLRHCEVPEWYQVILRDGNEHGGDTREVLSRHGVHLDHQFGQDVDSVSVYNAGSRGYLVEYYDSSCLLASIVIDDVAAYLEFRAKYLHAWAWLISEMERIAEATNAEKPIGRQGRKWA